LCCLHVSRGFFKAEIAAKEMGMPAGSYNSQLQAATITN
jgi:hypothetical protein